MQTAYLQGNYGKVIANITEALKRAKPESERARKELQYFRGRAAVRLGAYDLAESDLAPLKDFKLYSNWDSASFVMAKVRAMKALIPPRTQIVRDNAGKVLFRVHYAKADSYTKAILELLPAAYRANEKMFGIDQYETPVYIFQDYNRFREFHRGVNNRYPDQWLRGSGGRDGFFVCPVDGRGVRANLQAGYFRSMVAHELNHCMASRLYGITLPPEWMREGLAEIAGCATVPSMATWIDNRMAQNVANGHIVPLADLTNNFLKIVRENSETRGKNIPSPDPYAQGYSMSRFFLNSIKPGALPHFFMEVRESGDFAKSFQKYTGQTPEKFYNAWRRMMIQRHG